MPLCARILPLGRWQRVVSAFGLVVGLAVTVGANNHVDKTVTQTDRAALARMGVTAGPKPRDYAEELRRIAAIQRNVLGAIRVDNSIPPAGHAVEPEELLRRGQGGCYEISRAFEKGFALNNLRSRRVFHLYRQDRSFLSALVTRGHPSHATVEVHTSRGWLLVDSIVPWLALDKQGDPVPASGIWNHLDRFNGSPPEHLALSSWALRGIYSRNGQLYGSIFPVPEINWFDLSSWLMSPDESRHLY